MGQNAISACFSSSLTIILLSYCCRGPRGAHTLHSTGVIEYWPACVLMTFFPCLTLCYTNSFTDLNQKLGGRPQNPLAACCCACCCFLCLIAQDAESLDKCSG